MKMAYLIGLTFFVSSCASIKIASDYDENLHFGNYTTFKLLERESTFPVGANPINQQRIETGIKDRMIRLGFVEYDDPDLYVTYIVKKELRHGAESYDDYYDEWGAADLNIIQYKEGTLIMDLLDVQKGKVIWHGSLSRPTSENMSTAEKRINNNLDKMFARMSKEIQR